MDEIDIRILQLLQENARSTVSELSKKINLSRPSISERILRLQEQGVIEEFTSRVSLRAIGRRVLLFIELESLKAPPEAIEENFIGDEDILECHRVSGKNDYIIKAAVESIEDMTSLINRLIPFGNPCTSVVLTSPVPYRHVVPKKAPR